MVLQPLCSLAAKILKKREYLFLSCPLHLFRFVVFRCQLHNAWWEICSNETVEEDLLLFRWKICFNEWPDEKDALWQRIDQTLKSVFYDFNIDETHRTGIRSPSASSLTVHTHLLNNRSDCYTICYPHQIYTA